MRMWMVDPSLLCTNHLSGEHREMHALCGIIKAGFSLEGYFRNKLLDTPSIKSRHDELALEMSRRSGKAHASPLEVQPIVAERFTVNVQANVQELRRRCVHCKERIDERLTV